MCRIFEVVNGGSVRLILGCVVVVVQAGSLALGAPALPAGSPALEAPCPVLVSKPSQSEGMEGLSESLSTDTYTTPAGVVDSPASAGSAAALEDPALPSAWLSNQAVRLS